MTTDPEAAAALHPEAIFRFPSLARSTAPVLRPAILLPEARRRIAPTEAARLQAQIAFGKGRSPDKPAAPYGIDAVGLGPALIRRVQAMLFPIQIPVLKGH